MKQAIVGIAAGIAFAATLSAANAQNGRSFVSGHGLDSNACTLAAPCRTFAVAFTHTNAGGEIDVLDTAGYGPLTINKAISIVNDGSVASVLVPSGGIGIKISAGASDAVSLRGLTIEGAGVGSTGIQFITGKSLTIQNSVIRHLAVDGIDFFPNITSNISVSSTLVADNGGHGIAVAPNDGAGLITAVFNHVEANRNVQDGFLLSAAHDGVIDATVSDSMAARNDNGFHAFSNGGIVEVMLVRSVATQNGNGVSGAGIVAENTGSKIRIGQSVLTGNTNGWLVSSGAVVQSYGTNQIDGNGLSEVAPPGILNK